ncbi:MAG: hypothetical protein IT373_09440 [Polyangiaceae bacterium]|nr:hypothetical protein [Polyangiaceae bacterium]
MSPALAPCPSCQRHVRSHDASCPFCGTARRSARTLPALAAVIGAQLALAACERRPLAPVYGPAPEPERVRTATGSEPAPTTESAAPSATPAPDPEPPPVAVYGPPPGKDDLRR